MDIVPTQISYQIYPCLDILKDEKITYSSNVIFNSKVLSEIPFYTREFTTTKNYKLCTVDLNIPMTGNELAGKRARILLYLDEEMIFDATCHEPYNWNLKSLMISAKKINLLIGHHKIKLMGCVDGGNFYIPHFNTSFIENTISPPISGRLCIIGQN